MGMGIALHMPVAASFRKCPAEYVKQIINDIRIRILIDGDAGCGMRHENHCDPACDPALLYVLPDQRSNVDHLIGRRCFNNMLEHDTTLPDCFYIALVIYTILSQCPANFLSIFSQTSQKYIGLSCGMKQPTGFRYCTQKQRFEFIKIDNNRSE